MTGESEISDSGPSDDATDIIKSVKRYTARSVFEVSIRRIQTILKMVKSGIKNDTNKVSKLQINLSDPKLISNADTTVDKVKRLKNGLVEINLTERDVDILQKALTYNLQFNDELPFYLHNVLLVAAWGPWRVTFKHCLQNCTLSTLISSRHPDPPQKKR